MIDIHKAKIKFHHEMMRVLICSKYLLLVDLSVLKGDATFGEDHARFIKLVSPKYKTPYEYILSRLFITYVAAFEIFLQDVATAILVKNPQKIGKIQFALSEIIDSEGPEILINRAIDMTLNRLMYEKPQAYKDELANLLSIDLSAMDAKWSIFIEAKARRDLGVHADWICNQTYCRKVSDAGLTSKIAVGDSAIPNSDSYSDSYFFETVYALDSLAEDICIAVEKKHFLKPSSPCKPPEPPGPQMKASLIPAGGSREGLSESGKQTS